MLALTYFVNRSETVTKSESAFRVGYKKDKERCYGREEKESSS